jgi:adenylate kinase
LLKDQEHYEHVSIGDFARAEVEKKSALGLQIQPFVEGGSFVPDALINEVVEKILLSPHNLLLDGFPRTVQQAKMVVGRADRVILLSAPDDVCVDRILTREIDSATKTIYNSKYRKPDPDAKVVVRPFDRDESRIRQRLAKFHSSIAAILGVLDGKYQIVDTSRRTPEEAAAGLKLLLEQPLAKVIKTEHNQNCVICMSASADTLCVPCGHQCGCNKV